MKENTELFKREEFDPSKENILVSFEVHTSWKALKKTFLSNKLYLLSLVVMITIMLLALFVPMFIDYALSMDPNSPNVNLLPGEVGLVPKEFPVLGEDGKPIFEVDLDDDGNLVPVVEIIMVEYTYLFGTDFLGRDLWARLWFGLRASIILGLITTSINIIIGTIIGLNMGYYNRFDSIMLWVVKVLSSIPIVLILILFSVSFGASIGIMILSLTITGWIGPSQQVRSKVKVDKNLDFMVASKVLGTKNYKILISFIILAIPTIVNQFILIFPKMILFETTLGFLGLSMPDIPILGNIINDGKDQLFTFPYQLFIPIGFLVTSILSIQIVSSGIQDAFNTNNKGGN